MISRSNVKSIFRRPLKILIGEASSIHKTNFDENKIQLSALLSIKTGGCPENCAYCPQSAHYKTGINRKKLISLQEVRQSAIAAKENGATRFCMGAAWREVKDGPEFDSVLEMVKEVKNLDLEVCCTLGMINASQAIRLKNAGLHAYNHNIDSSREYYSKIITTRTYDDRLRTIQNVRGAGITVCTGGIIGMGESEEDRIGLLQQLASFDPHPESVTINALIPIEGTPLQCQQTVSVLDLVRVIATARCLMPKSLIRLSAGRKTISSEGQFLCFLAGANSIFLGDTLLTSGNPSVESDNNLLKQIGIKASTVEASL
jgi:biotin synthase